METIVLQAKKVLMVLLPVLMPLLTNAQTKVEFDGIWYNLVPKAKQAKVISSGDTKYTGLIIIPTTVTYEGVTYSVTSIGDGAFEGCSSLTFINIPESVTSIGSSAFRGCSSLTSINIPESVTSIGNSIFYECTGLTSITLPEGMTSIGYSTFNGCSSLTSITIPKSVTSIEGYAFFNCASITSITIPEGVTKIGSYAFSDCTNLTSITLPEGVTSIGECAFFGCTSLTSITIPEGVTGIASRTFEACSSLASITLPEGVTNIVTGAFRGCSRLTTIVLPKSVRKIYSESLANCPELTDVYCHSENVPSTETNAFNGSWINYATLHVPASALNAYKATAPWSNFGKIETLEITIDNITLNLSTATLAEGEELTLTATITPDDATDKSVSWTSSIPSVATVDNVGKVTAIAPGTATITAKANDSSGVSASCEVTVTPASYVIAYLIDGEVFLTDTLTRGSAISLPDVPTKEGYTFSGWGDVPETMPAEDVTASGTFIPNKYLVTFKIGDEVVAADSLEYKSAIIAPEAPEKEGYTFNGWGVVADSVPAHDLTYEGSYSINFYALTYMVDGEVVLTLSVAYGATIPSLKAPDKEGYTFSGWSEAPETMPAKDVTIEGTFTQLPSIYLTINQADNGYVKQHLVQGTSCTFVIEAAEGWKIHTVTFNGEDVTSQLTEEGTFTTPELQGDAVLNIAYEKIDDAIESTRAGAIKVQGHQGIISIAGATDGAAIGLYATDGTLVATATAEGDTTHFTVPTGQVYIVKVADTVVKIGM